MPRSTIPVLRVVLLALGLSVVTDPGFAQPPTAPAPQPLPGVNPPTFAAERRGSPVATLERLTGERATEPGREREEEGERERDEIETDRDSFTPATTTAGRGRLIVESAYSFIDNRTVKETHSFPELVLRYGLTKRIELRLGWNYEVGGAGNDVTGIDVGEDELPSEQDLERESNVAFGVKFKVTDNEGWIPGSALILQGFSPTSGKATDSQFVSTYVFGWELPHRLKLDAALRYGTGSEE